MIELGAENVDRDGQRARRHRRAPSSQQPSSCSAPARCRCSTWPPRTRPSRTRACASRPGRSCGSSGPTAPSSTTSRRTAAQVLDRRPGAKVNYCLGRVVESRHRRGGQDRRPQAGKTGTTAEQHRRLVRRLHAASSPPRSGWATRSGQPADGATCTASRPCRAAPSRPDLEAVHGARGRGHRHRLVPAAPLDRRSSRARTSTPSCGTDAAAADHRAARRPSPRRPTTTEKKKDDPPPKDGDDGARTGCTGAVDGLVRVVGAAGEAPPLHLVDHLHARPACPTARG